MSYWRVASEEINYRRFFDVNTLAAIRMELPEVFDATHRLLLELIAAGFVTGVRIDHIDGLANPAEYLAWLQAHAATALGREGEKEVIYLLVEKILGAGERLVMAGRSTARQATNSPMKRWNCFWTSRPKNPSRNPTRNSSAARWTTGKSSTAASGS